MEPMSLDTSLTLLNAEELGEYEKFSKDEFEKYSTLAHQWALKFQSILHFRRATMNGGTPVPPADVNAGNVAPFAMNTQIGIRDRADHDIRLGE